MPARDAFALLDDALAEPGVRASRLYEGWAGRIDCVDPARVEDWWREVEAEIAADRFVVLAIDYEWGARLQGIDTRAEGLASALVFGTMRRLDTGEVDGWLAARSRGAAGFVDWQANVDRAGYDLAIDRIHRLIAAGETYQINYSYRLDGAAFGDPVALYRRLRTRQPVHFGALIAEPDDARWTLSLSPELFVEHRDGSLQARPMKGTAARSGDEARDRAAAAALQSDPKNRAENLMIVDLLRNDLGRLAETGSVQVPRLFEIEDYPTLLQMTSTVEARARAGLRFPEVLRAMFPCGSITGAPKRQTMRRIAELETTPRGRYTGAIGWLDRRAGASCPDFALSVAIRTVDLGAPRDDGLRPARAGIGGGIVIDSRAGDEWDETRLKARFLGSFDPGLALIETMRLEHGVIAWRERHLERLASSARRLGFAIDLEEIEDALDAESDARLAAAQRLRLELGYDGRFDLRRTPLDSLPAGRVAVALARLPRPAEESALASMKTTLRASYDAAIIAAERRGAFDCLFFDDEDHLLEGARTNVFVRLDGRWRTPRRSSRLLPGVMRAVLLEDRSLDAKEAIVTRQQLLQAERLIVCNALRGALEAEVWDQSCTA